MSISKFLFFLFAFGMLSCSQQPKKLSGRYETIEVVYVNWACDCANFVDFKHYKQDSNYTVLEKDCFYIEASNPKKEIPENYYDSLHFEYSLKLYGQFYSDKGVPDSYPRKTEQRPDKARVFRYDNFRLVKKDK